MKPFVDKEKKEASCEFCGKVIAKVVDGKWVKELSQTKLD